MLVRPVGPVIGLTGCKSLQRTLCCIEIAGRMDRLNAHVGCTGVEVLLQSALNLVHASGDDHGVNKPVAATAIEIGLGESETEPAAAVVRPPELPL